MDFTLDSNNKNKEEIKRRFEDATIRDIELFDEELQNILIDVSNWDKDVDYAKNLIMHKLLLFVLQGTYDENVLHRYSWEYFKKNKKELEELVP